jgi:hypothetical protein
MAMMRATQQGVHMIRFVAFLVLLFAATPALAQISYGVRVCNPAYPSRCVAPAADGAIPTAGSSFTVISTNADTVIKASPGTFVGLTVNTAGTGSTAVVYNNTTCTGATIGTFTTAAQVALPSINATATTGICVTTAGAGAANITVLWR